MISLDIETTGVDPKDNCMVSLGAVSIDNEYSFYKECRITPGALVSDKALEINGFTMDQISDGSKAHPVEVLEDFILWAKDMEDKTLMGWNVGSFDAQFLLQIHREYGVDLDWIFPYRYVDLHSMAHLILGKSVTSIEACREFGVVEEPSPHNAMSGALMNVRLYDAMTSILHDHGADEATGWIVTAEGRDFNYVNVTTDMIDIVDIAHALSNCCRFAGHTRNFYSVGSHSVMAYIVAREMGLSAELQLTALLHDATEAYVCDVPSPAKAMLSDFQRLEKRIAKAISDKFGIDLVNLPPEIKRIDRNLLWWEARQLFPKDTTGWTQDPDIDVLEDLRIYYMSNDQVKIMFQEAYHDIIKKL